MSMFEENLMTRYQEQHFRFVTNVPCPPGRPATVFDGFGSHYVCEVATALVADFKALVGTQQPSVADMFAARSGP